MNALQLGVVLTTVVLILVCILIWGGYERLATGRWPYWTGFGGYISPRVPPNKTFQRGKTLWDLMQLLIIPVVLAGGAYWLNESARQSEQAVADQRAQIERNIAADNIQETALQTYLDKMTELLLQENLRKSEKESEVRAVARARTLTVLRSLNNNRKGALLRFLYEADLIQKDKIVIDLRGADLNEADLYGTDLREANLYGAELFKATLFNANLNRADLREANLIQANLIQANLDEADLRRANLDEADLREANLNGTDLREANLNGADLRGANLNGADLREANLNGADLREANLKGSKLIGAKYTKNTEDTRDTIWPESFDPDASGAVRFIGHRYFAWQVQSNLSRSAAPE